MGFEFPATHELRDHAVEEKRIEDVDVIDHEEAGAVGIECRVALALNLGAGKENDAAAEAALKPVVFTRIEKNRQKYQSRRSNKEMQQA